MPGCARFDRDPDRVRLDAREVPEVQDQHEDLVGQRCAARASGARSSLAGVWDRRRAEASYELRWRRRAAGEAQVAEGQQLDDGFAHISFPTTRGFHGREQVDDFSAPSSPQFVGQTKCCVFERSSTISIAKTK